MPADSNSPRLKPIPEIVRMVRDLKLAGKDLGQVGRVLKTPRGVLAFERALEALRCRPGPHSTPLGENPLERRDMLCAVAWVYEVALEALESRRTGTDKNRVAEYVADGLRLSAENERARLAVWRITRKVWLTRRRGNRSRARWITSQVLRDGQLARAIGVRRIALEDDYLRRLLPRRPSQQRKDPPWFAEAKKIMDRLSAEPGLVVRNSGPESTSSRQQGGHNRSTVPCVNQHKETVVNGQPNRKTPPTR